MHIYIELKSYRTRKHGVAPSKYIVGASMILVGYQISDDINYCSTGTR